MAVQLIRKVRDRQPQALSQIDKTNPITRGLIVLTNPAESLQNIAVAGAKFSNPVSRAASYGVGVAARTSATVYHLLPDAAYNRPNEITVMVFARRSGFVQPYASVLVKNFNSNSSPSYSTWAIECNFAGSGQNIITAFSSTSSGYARTPNYDISDATIPHALVLTRSESVLRLFADGSMAGEVSGLSALSYASTGDNDICINNFVTASPFDVYLVAQWNRVLSNSEIISLSENPWQLFEPETIPLFFSTVTAQFLRPISDIANSGWTPSAGSDLFSCIGEAVRNDSTYISATAPGAICEVLLGTSAGDPLSSINHLPRIVMSAGSGGIILRLKQGTTIIKEWTYSTLAGSDTLYEPTLTSGEIDAISDYTDLRLEMETTA